MLHVTADGSLAVTMAAPLTERRQADRFLSEVMKKLKAYCDEVGSSTVIKGASFSRLKGPVAIRITIDGQQASERSRLAVAGVPAYCDGELVGMGSYPPEAKSEFHGESRIFFHGTNVWRAVQILTQGGVTAEETHTPIGFYTCLQPRDSYVQGAIVEVICTGMLCSLRETQVLMSRETPLVPEGYIARIKRSAEEYVMNPLSAEVIAITFVLESLQTVIDFDLVPVRLPPPQKEERFAAEAASSSTDPRPWQPTPSTARKAAALPPSRTRSPPSTRTEAERAAGLKADRASYTEQVARVAASKAAAAAAVHAKSLAATHQLIEVKHKMVAAASTSAHPAAAALQTKAKSLLVAKAKFILAHRPKTPTKAAPKTPTKATPKKPTKAAPTTPPMRPPAGLLYRENNSTFFLPAAAPPTTDDWEDSWGKWR